jgi:ribosomal protein S18 acetylase RimI-like enzyme
VTTALSKVACSIRRAQETDRAPIWDIFRAVVAPGDTYAFDPAITRDEALAYWCAPANWTYVAEKAGAIAGTYLLRANQPDPGSHVANAAFMVAPSAQRTGVGRSMAEHCLGEACRLGFRAMQFNYVVSTNEGAVRLWKQLGFGIVGTLPGAFRHPRLGFVDVYVMFKELS